MERIDTGDHLFTEGDAQAGTLGTPVRASWLNSLQEEIANAIEAHGVALNPAARDQLKTVLLTKLNADKVDGFHASQTPAADQVVVVKSDSSTVLPGAMTAAGLLTATGLTVTTGNVTPQADSSRSVGTASLRWNTIYAVNGAIQTSDAREKTGVDPLTPAEIAAARELAGEIGSYRMLAAVAEKGENARKHIGMTVQRAIEVMEAHGLNPFAYGLICYDQWPDQYVDHPAVLDEEENVVEEARRELVVPAGDRYGFRHDELLLFIARGQLAAQLEIEARLAALEAR